MQACLRTASILQIRMSRRVGEGRDKDYLPQLFQSKPVRCLEPAMIRF